MYILKTRWPAVQSEPFLENERFMMQGTAFHRAVHQYFLGLDETNIEETLTSENLINWWQNFQAFIHKEGLESPEVKKFPEFTLTTMINHHRVIGKFDLICIFPESHIRIFDWKTNHTRPKQAVMADRMQTILYPYLVTYASEDLTGTHPVPPEQIELTYWFANFSDETLLFQYSAIEFEQAEANLKDLVSLIERLVENGDEFAFPKTDEIKKCAYCEYRSLCDRGIQAGQDLENPVEEQDLAEFDFDQITELLNG